MARIVSVEVVGGERLGAELIAAGDKLARITPPIVRDYGRELQRRVRRNASGRPGPNVVTGAYRESIKYRTFSVALGLGAEVYSDAPQAMRLEYGFVGMDSLGRHYSQPPFPHFRPAVESIRPEFYAAVAIAIDTVIK